MFIIAEKLPTELTASIRFTDEPTIAQIIKREPNPPEDTFSGIVRRIMIDYANGSLRYGKSDAEIDYQIKQERLRLLKASADIKEHLAKAYQTSHDKGVLSNEAKEALKTHAQMQSNKDLIPNFSMTYQKELGEYQIRCKLGYYESEEDAKNKVQTECDFVFFSRSEEECKQKFLIHATNHHNAGLYKSMENLA